MADRKAVIKNADMCVSPAAAGEPVLLLSVSSPCERLIARAFAAAVVVAPVSSILN